jgi:NAD(P)-dependent dehydrogenase (short-subunit alcohol dehydrogenase family)
MKSILITGASTGIGEACARYLAERGWQVFAGVRRTEDAEKLQSVSINIKALQLDVTKSKQIAEVFANVQQIVGKGGLQGLINNAGIAVVGPLEFLPIADLRNQMEVNFIGQVEVTQTLLPLLRLGHGRVVNISSIGGRATSHSMFLTQLPSMHWKLSPMACAASCCLGTYMLLASSPERLPLPFGNDR